MAGNVAILCLAACLAIAISKTSRGNCGVDLHRAPNAPDPKFRPIMKGEVDHIDLEDQLFSQPDRREYQDLAKRCARGESATCMTFGIQQWNLTYYHIVASQNVRGSPCAQDWEVWPHQCGREVICRKINGLVRVVGISAEITAERVEAWAGLPYLYAIDTSGGSDLDVAKSHLPASLRVVTYHYTDPDDFAKFAALMRKQGQIQSVFLPGRQDLLNWLKLDLSELCGLDLIHFTSYVVNIVDSTIPACWSKMKNLQSFYCTNCMMTSPPVAFKGLLSLRSFIAFRQSEMVPCAVDKIALNPMACKPSWETKHAFKSGGTRTSTGHWGDFQEGPSFSCPESAYSFPFEEILNLGWTNVQKVWLDGNFLTGTIPANIADIWPSLRSLDLYGNNMTGSVPEGLGKLNLQKLQLQDNHFSGELPKSVANLLQQTDITLGLSRNAELHGCVPPVHGRGRTSLGGTMLTECSHDEF